MVAKPRRTGIRGGLRLGMSRSTPSSDPSRFPVSLDTRRTLGSVVARAQPSMSVFMPAPEPEAAVFLETPEQASVTRADLWAVATAARTFFRRVSTGRMDTVHFAKAEEALEKALSDVPVGAW